MAEIRFYHLQTQDTEQALPQILQKALAGGRRVVVKNDDGAYIKRLNDQLWTFRPDSFLPHGTAQEGYEADQPVWLTTLDENPNSADVLILTGGAVSENLASYDLCCEMFDGRNDEMIKAARQKWAAYKDSGYEVTYWQQNSQGGWDKKA